MARRYVPQPIRDIFGQRFFATTVLFGTATLSTALLDYGSTRREVAAVVTGILVGLIIDLWTHSLRLEQAATDHNEAHKRLVLERDDAVRERDQTLEELRRQAEVEAENLRLTYERDDLLRRATAPRTLLEDVLQTIDGQLEILGLVQKHRAIQSGGAPWQWAVTSIRLHDETLVAVTAHADDPTPYANEWVGVVSRGTTIATAQASPTGNQLTLLVPLENLPEELQDPLLNDGMAPSAGYVLRLLGIELTPYQRLHDEKLATLSTKLRDAASAVSAAVVGESPQLLVEEENP